jgi:hypothetical protein
VPLIKPEIQKVLRASGLDTSEPSEAPQGSISEKLDRAGLSKDELADELSIIIKSSGNESLRLRAIEQALKAHGVLKESQPVAVPSFTVIIKNSTPSLDTNSDSLNQILFPRASCAPTKELTN